MISSPLCTLVSKLIFKVEYSIIGQVLKRNYCGFDGNNIATFIDFYLLADTLHYKSNCLGIESIVLYPARTSNNHDRKLG